MFKKLKQMFGVGGPEVDAVLQSGSVRPGEVLRGEIRITGGDDDREFSALTLAYRANVEVDAPGAANQDQGMPGGHRDHDPDRPGRQTDADPSVLKRFNAVQVQGPGVIRAGSSSAIPFELPVPWDMPFNVLRGRVFERMALGLETRFDLPGGKDATDFDPLRIECLPVHEAVVAAMERQGYRLAHADLEKGAAPGSTLELHNELEFVRGRDMGNLSISVSGLPGGVQEAELTFVTGPAETTVVLSLQRKALLVQNRDRFATFSGPTDGAFDWDGALAHHIQQLLDAGGAVFG